ncbi:MAG: DNA-processing protein DprA [Candidatus Fimenecus sp.]
MNDEIYWIWLLRCLGPAAPIADMIEVFGSARGVYEAGTVEWRLSGILTAKQIAALSKYSPSESGGVLRACRENDWEILTPDSVYYPQKLRELRNFPPVLFLQGDKEVLLREVKIAMVGTRKATNYSLRVATALAQSLSAAGVTVVSGGALGIDSAAHSGALRAGGKTIAVLGCGLGTDYLRENAALRREISENGALITEFLPFSPASRTTFPLRNRIISALSLGTVVVEAGEHSGSLITARYAMEQGRDVFAVPGDVISSAFTGANKLIHDGAKPVFSPLDILEEYVYTYSDTINPEAAERVFQTVQKLPPHRSVPAHAENAPAAQKAAPPKASANPVGILPETASKNAQAVYAALGNGERHIDELCEATALSVGEALAALTELELYGCAALTQGKKYKKI